MMHSPSEAKLPNGRSLSPLSDTGYEKLNELLCQEHPTPPQ